MNLDQALNLVAQAFGFDAESLKAYAAEDTVGGFHKDESKRQWNTGSLWAVEGQVLYALVRALRPKLCIELGTWEGCSATHILTALQANGDGGRLICIDKVGGRGAGIPDTLRGGVEIVAADGADWINQYLGNGEAALIYEDTDHSTETTRAIWEAGMPKLAAGGVMVSHDAMHYLVGAAIRTGILQAGAQEGLRVFRIDPEDMPDAESWLCGLAIWRAPLDRVFSEPKEISPALSRPTKRDYAPRKKKVVSEGEK